MKRLLFWLVWWVLAVVLWYERGFPRGYLGVHVVLGLYVFFKVKKPRRVWPPKPGDLPKPS